MAFSVLQYNRKKISFSPQFKYGAIAFYPLLTLLPPCLAQDYAQLKQEGQHEKQKR